MPHRGSERYYETVWASLSEGLQKRVLAAVRKSIEARTPESIDDEVIVSSLSDDHRKEVEWLVSGDSANADPAFTLSEGGGQRPGLKLSVGMESYLEHHILGS